jgi:hypothetical protein
MKEYIRRAVLVFGDSPALSEGHILRDLVVTTPLPRRLLVTQARLSNREASAQTLLDAHSILRYARPSI